MRPGGDATVACVGQALSAGLDAADELAADGVDVEVISLRTLSPLDLDGLTASSADTGRLIVVEESPPRCSVAADIAASVTESAFTALRHPPLRVTAAASPGPVQPGARGRVAPTAARVATAVRAPFAASEPRPLCPAGCPIVAKCDPRGPISHAGVTLPRRRR